MSQSHATPSVPPFSKWLHLCYAVMLFLLAAGKIRVGFSIAARIEDFLPLLLIPLLFNQAYRRFDYRQWRPYLPGLMLVLVGLGTCGLVMSSPDNWSRCIQIITQATVGFLLAEWISHNRNNRIWQVAFLGGLIVMLGYVRWGQFDNPDHTGSFGHRNNQTAFIILTIPLLWKIWKNNHHWCSRTLILLISSGMLAFVGLYRSRSAVIGGMALGVCGLLQIWKQRRFSVRQIVVLAIFVLVLLGLLLTTASRFEPIRENFQQPFSFSRLTVWRAVSEGLAKADNWWFGTGTGDCFDRLLLETRNGNLLPESRRALHPHNQLIYWLYSGGIVSLTGWLLVLAGIYRVARHNSEQAVSIAALTGFLFFELSECTFLWSRVATIFWLNVFLLKNQLSANKTPIQPNQASCSCCGLFESESKPARGLTTILTLFVVPLVLFIHQSYAFPETLSMVLLMSGALVATRLSQSGQTGFKLCVVLLLSLLVGILIRPFQAMLLLNPEVTLPVGGVLLGTACWKARQSKMPQHNPSLLPGLGLVAIGVLIPAGLVIFSSLSLLFASAEVPVKSLDIRSSIGPVLLSSWLWLGITAWLAINGFNWSKTKLRWPVLLPISVAMVILLGSTMIRAVVLCPRIFAKEDHLSVKHWEEVLAKSQQLGLGILDQALHKKALTSAISQRDPLFYIETFRHTPQKPDTAPVYPHAGVQLMAAGRPEVLSSSEDQPIYQSVMVDYKQFEVWLLRQDGYLESHQETSAVVLLPQSDYGYVDGVLDSRGNPLILTRDGQLLRVKDSQADVLIPSDPNHIVPIYEKLTWDPVTNSPVALDTYGNLYFMGESESWVMDDRFAETASFQGQAYDIARAITIDQSHRITLLTCFGELWWSNLSDPARTIHGPEYGDHYWPSSPIGQEILTTENRQVILDRLGGLFPSPRPEGISPGSANSYLLPRSLPLNNPVAVDLACFPNQAWVLILCRDGRLLPNARWAHVYPI